MAHVLIAGTTDSGKTALAKELIRRYSFPALVCDPMGANWDAERVYQDPHRFLDVARRSTNCALICDEAANYIRLHTPEFHWLATQSRHRGHVAHFLAQRPKMLPPVIRGNCGVLFLFRVSRDDAKELAIEFTRDELLEAPQLEQGEFFKVTRFEPPQRLRLFKPKRRL